jgi:hypothetical protein
MDYFRIELCPSVDKSLCVLEDGPEGTQPFSYAMARGETAAADYPADAKWFMHRRWSGIKLASLIANTANLLVVHKSLKGAIHKLGVPVESYGFALYDHKKRLASRDYFIVNPLGRHDVLDLKASQIEWSPDDPTAVVDVEEMVLDPRKIAKAPPLLRVQEDPEAILIERMAARKLAALDPTNFFLREVRQSS